MKETGDLIYRKQTTGKLLFKRDGESAYVDFGNVRMHKYAPKIERTKTMVARKGYVQLVEERPTQVEHRWTVGLDEELPDLVRLHLLAGEGTEVEHAAITSATTMDISSPEKGKAYLLNYTVTVGADEVTYNALNVSDVTVTATGPVTYVEGTDYKLDAGAGTITILNESSIPGTGAITVSFKMAAATTLEHTGFTELAVKGSAVFDEYDQHSEVPRARYTFPAQIHLTNGGDNDGKKLSEFEVELLATGQIVRKSRVDA